ncbi:hypothetical protein DFH27DRAFT_569450 [Peziza echinospora]|nr:hypothetical protein DFH27DRAFT_569450 [Peziza echinospora]
MVNGQDRQAVAAVKASIQKLLVGKVVLTDEGKPLWDPVLRGVEGQELIRQVCEAGSVHVHCDARNQQIRLYGSLEDCEITEQTLKEDYSLLLSKEHEIVLDERMKRMGTRGGFLAVKLVAGEENVFLDPSGEKLIVRCSPLDIAKVKSLLMQPPSMKQLLKGMKAATAEEQLPAMEEGTCPVCTEPAETPFVRTACGHVYCEGCFSGYVKSALDSRKFPIQCFHNSRENTQCNTPFPIALLQRALSHADADQLFEASFAGHVQSLPGTYSYCPTPDCPTVYTVTPLDDDQHITTCSQCLVGICTTCKAPAHYGQSCHQHQQPTDLEERFTEWKAASGVKDCPRCGIGMQKTMGCNHMTCHCGAHVCWTCMREFPRETIYQHMRDACGGSGIAGDPGPNENPPPNAGGALLDAEERRAQAELLLFWQNRQILLAGRAVHDAATLERAARWITEREARRGRGGNGGGNLVDVQVPGAPGIPGLRNPFVPQGVGRRMVVRGPGGAHFGRR